MCAGLTALFGSIGGGKPEHFSELQERLTQLGRPLQQPSDLDDLIEASAAARVILMGEATHGTREFYTWRAEITKRLVAEQRISMVIVEGDWRTVLRLNHFLSGADSNENASTLLRRISRWPEWMWGNVQFAELLEWLRRWNRGRDRTEQVRLYGMDVYGHEESLEAVDAFLRRWHPDRAKEVRRHYGLLRRFWHDGSAYTQHLQQGGASAESGAAAGLQIIRSLQRRHDGPEPEDYFFIEQDAHVVAGGEAYFRTNGEPTVRSWNIRAEHMWQTVQRLLHHHGPASRAVVWAHNTHVGDARATDMGTMGMNNIGRLSREALGRERVLGVGFATFRGQVVAGSSWGARRRVYKVPEARPDSWDFALQAAYGGDRYVLFDKEARRDPALLTPKPQRAIGVVYRVREERTTNYTQTVLPRRFDALLFISETHAVEPLH